MRLMLNECVCKSVCGQPSLDPVCTMVRPNLGYYWGSGSLPSPSFLPSGHGSPGSPGLPGGTRRRPLGGSSQCQTLACIVPLTFPSLFLPRTKSLLTSTTSHPWNNSRSGSALQKTSLSCRNRGRVGRLGLAGGLSFGFGSTTHSLST